MHRRSTIRRALAGCLVALCLGVTACTSTGEDSSTATSSSTPASAPASTAGTPGHSTTAPTTASATTSVSQRSRPARTDGTTTGNTTSTENSPSSSTVRTRSSTTPTTSSQPPRTHHDSSKAVIARIMSSTVGGKAIATAKGTLHGPGSTTVAMVAQVLAIRRGEDSTVLVWLLKTASGKEVRTSSFQLAYPPLQDTRLISLVDRKAGKSYYPYTYVPYQQPGGQDTGCLCSDVPESTDGHGTVLHAVMPALPSGTSSVDVKIPGFSTMTSVPVTS